MATIELIHKRVGNDIQMAVQVLNNGDPISWSEVTALHALLISDSQRVRLGSCTVDGALPQDATTMMLTYSGKSPQYLGVARLVLSFRYRNHQCALDAPVLCFVSSTSEEGVGPVEVYIPADVDPEVNSLQIVVGGGGSASWGAITGNITNQTDLIALLGEKQDNIDDLQDIREGAAAGATAYQKPGSGIPASDMAEAVQTSLGLADSAYQKPSGGIPAEDIASDVIPTALADLSDDATHRVVTDTEKSTWSGKQDAIADLSDIRAGAAAGATAYQKPSGGIPSTDMASAVVTSLGKADSAYQKPGTGIPASDLSSAVQTSLGKADSAVQPAALNQETARALAAEGLLEQAIEALNYGEGVTVTTLPTASSSTANKIYYVGPDANNQYDRYFTSYDGSAYSWVSLGSTIIDLTTYAKAKDLTRLEDEVGASQAQTIDPLAYALRNFSLNTNGTYGSSVNYKHVIVPVAPGDVFLITANNSYVSRYAFFDRKDVPTAGGDAPLLAGTSRASISIGETASIVIPDGTAYLFIYLGQLTNDAYPYQPATVVKVTSTNTRVTAMEQDFATYVGDKTKLVSKTMTTEDITSYKTTGYYKKVDLTNTSSSGYAFYVVPVVAGTVFNIKNARNISDVAPSIFAYNSVTSKYTVLSTKNTTTTPFEGAIPEGFDRLVINERDAAGERVIIKEVTNTINDLITSVQALEAVAPANAETNNIVKSLIVKPVNDYALNDSRTAVAGTYTPRDGDTPATLVTAKTGQANPNIYEVLTNLTGRYASVYLKVHVTSCLSGARLQVLLYRNETTGQVINQEIDMTSGGDIQVLLSGKASSNFGTPRLYLLTVPPESYTSGDTICTLSIEYAAVFDNQAISDVEIADEACAEGFILSVANEPKGTENMTWAAIGDSITAQGTYLDTVSSMLGLGERAVIATGGQKMSGSSGMWTDEVINAIPSGTDIVTILAGTNDWAQSVSLGTDTSADTNTYKGAICTAVKKIYTSYPFARLFFITPPYGELPGKVTSDHWDNDWTNTLGLSVRDYALAAQEVCNTLGVPCLNLAASMGIGHENLSNFVKNDGGQVHPNALGGKRLGRILAKFIEQLV